MKQKSAIRNFPGTSLLISIGFIGIIVIVSIGVSSLVAASVRQSSNVNQANQAYYAAEGALEAGLYENLISGGPGYTGNKSDVYNNCQPNDPKCESTLPKASYKILGQVPTDVNKNQYSDYFGIPSPGTGSAGSDCNALDPYLSGIFWYSATKTPHYVKEDPQDSSNYVQIDDAKDHPCNWNRIKVGESVSIPLYVLNNNPLCPVDETTGKNVCNPKDMNMTALNIRVRTACEDNVEMCSAGERFDLKSSAPSSNQFKGDDPIVSWQIVGTDSKGEQNYVLQPKVDYLPAPTYKWPSNSAIIHESKMNTAQDLVTMPFRVLLETRNGKDQSGITGTIINFLKNGGSWATQTLFKPVLKLSVIHSLEDLNSNNKVPYLEYQILTNSNMSIAPTDSSQTITAEGFSGSFKQVIEVKKPQESGLLEYVIQQ